MVVSSVLNQTYIEDHWHSEIHFPVFLFLNMNMWNNNSAIRVEIFFSKVSSQFHFVLDWICDMQFPTILAYFA